MKMEKAQNGGNFSKMTGIGEGGSKREGWWDGFR